MAGPSRRRELFIPPYIHPHPTITYTREASQIRDRDLVMLEGRPCRTTGPLPSQDRQGNFELHFIGYDIFHHIRYEQNAPSASIMYVPYISHKDWQLEDIVLDRDRPHMTIPTVAKLYDRTNANRKYVKLLEVTLTERLKADHADETKTMIFCTVTSCCREDGITSYRAH